jgi:hypothetical protein
LGMRKPFNPKLAEIIPKQIIKESIKIRVKTLLLNL